MQLPHAKIIIAENYNDDDDDGEHERGREVIILHEE